MKKKTVFTKVLAMALAAVMVMSMAACGSQQANTPTSESTVKESTQPSESTPVASEPETKELTYPLDTDTKLSIWVANTITLASGISDVKDSPVHMGFSERTGVEIDWQFLPAGAGVGASYSLLWTEPKKPQIVMYNMTNDRATGLYNDGFIWDLTDYIPEYAPDFWAYMNQPENLELLEQLKNNEGRILRIPPIVESEYNQTYQGFIIRKDWLDACGLDLPVTIADWEEVLAAFKEKYNAGIAFDAQTTVCGTGFIASGFDALGFMPWELPVVKDDKVTFAPVEPEYKEMMETIVAWWEKGYIDHDSATLDMSGVRTKAMNNEAGIIPVPMSQYTNVIADAEAQGNGAEWVALCNPRVAEGQPTSFINTASSRLLTPGSAVITTSASEDEMKLALQMLNYAFTEEGIMFTNFGEEGVSYTMVDGKPQLTELVTKDELGLNDAIKKYSFKSGSCFGVQLAALVAAKNNPIVAEAPYVWTENTEAPSHYFPSGATLTTEEIEIKNELESAIRTYDDEQTIKFLIGDRDMSEWDDFVKELYDKYDLQKYLDVYQAAYDRYVNR